MMKHGTYNALLQFFFFCMTLYPLRQILYNRRLHYFIYDYLSKENFLHQIKQKIIVLLS